MPAIEVTEEGGRTIVQPLRSGSAAGQILLGCGILSSLLYAATDISGGLLYPGYSFASQTISELAAKGAPSEPFVAPLFLVYDVLALAFGIGVFLEAAGRSRALRITGALLIGHAVVGFVGAAAPSFFEMDQRGAGSLASDAPHIVLMAVIVLLLLLAIGFGAFTLGRRFRIYSFATLLTIVLFGALTARFAASIGAGQPTPRVGIIERIDVYAPLLWIAVLAVALLQRRRRLALEVFR